MHTCKYRIEEWRGKRYGHLTIVDYSEGYFECVCDCGRETRVKPTHLTSEKTKTCGDKDCEYHRYLVYTKPKETAKHGGCGTRLYKIWDGMKNRCYIKSCCSYPLYGGRGIKICEEWKTDFAKFRDWALANGYEDGLSIDRIDPNGNYEPGNCRWATAKEQRANQRDTERGKKVTINGVTRSKSEWAAEYGVSPAEVYYYEVKRGMPFEQALKRSRARKDSVPEELKAIPEEERHKYFVMKGKVYKYKAYED